MNSAPYRHILFSLCVFFFNKSACTAKIIPAENASLHYNRIYFEEELIKNATSYELIYFDSVDGSKRNAEKHLYNKLPAFWTEGLKWNTTYYWYVKVYGKQKQVLLSGLQHRFDIFKIESQNFEESRLVVKTNNSQKNAGGYICLDYSRSIYNRAGDPIWTIPKSEYMHPQQNQIRDMRVTADNTITFLNGSFPLEIDLDGNILWSAPYPYTIGADTVFYHHDFKKTNRGTYIVMGNKRAYRKVIGDYPLEKLSKEFEVKMIDNQLYCKVLMNIILEFNKEGKLIWFWDANDYVEDSDLNYKKGPMRMPGFATHANAFSENEAGTKVYVGFRDLSRIVKIDKLSKKVEQSYGEKYPSGEARLGSNLFKRQHDATITKRNTILLFNNNSPPGGNGDISSVMEIKEEGAVTDSLVVWKFDLNFDSLSSGKSVSGGNVIELPNTDLLVCAGLLNRVFEVTRKKEIVWDAFIQAKKAEETIWRDSPQYRCNFVKELKWYHFLCENVSLKVNGNTGLCQLKVYNTCQQTDSYIIDLINENGQGLQRIETGLLEANKSFEQTILLNEKELSAKELSVMVKSKHSPELKILKINR